MLRNRLVVSLSAVSLLLAFGACSSDDEEPKSNPKSGSASSASESATIYPVDGCQAQVKVTGGLKVSWKGNGQVSDSGDATVYQSSNGKKSWMAVTTKSGKTPAQVVVTVQGTTYNVVKKGLEIDESKDGATVKGRIAGPNGKKATVNATFTCKSA